MVNPNMWNVDLDFTLLVRKIVVFQVLASVLLLLGLALVKT